MDAIHSVEEAAEVAGPLAKELRTTLAITGAIDLVTDGEKAYHVLNGHELMGYVTGTGCTASALIGAFLAVNDNPAEAATTALAYFGLAGEKASLRAKAPGSFQVALIDALFSMKKDALREGAKIQG